MKTWAKVATRILRFTNFTTSNGSDVHVYMVASDAAKDAAAVEKVGFVDLGAIKGNIGDQNYALGSDLDLAKYHAVSICCKRFSVNFRGSAFKADTDLAKSIGSHLGLGTHPSTE